MGKFTTATRSARTRLTPRQEEIRSLLVKGLSEHQMAARLHRSPHTVHNHVKAIYRALEVSSRHALLVRCASGADRPDGGRGAAAEPIPSHAPLLIVQVRQDGTIESVNHPWLGPVGTHVVGERLLRWVSPGDRDRYRSIVSRAFTTGAEVEFKLTLIGRGDHEHRWHTHFVPVVEHGVASRGILLAYETAD